MDKSPNGTIIFTWNQRREMMVSHYSIVMKTSNNQEFNFTSITKSIIIPTSKMYKASLTTFGVCGGRSEPVSFRKGTNEMLRSRVAVSLDYH